MAQRLKAPARTAEAIGRDERKLRETVERIIDDVRTRGDAAVRQWSIELDNWDRDGYRLGNDEIRDCIGTLSSVEIEDLGFAQDQVRNFAERQRACLLDLEVETLPGVTLGHRNIPIDSVGCYVPGGRYPLLASAHMSVLTAKVAGCRRVITCAPPFEGRPAPAIVAAQHLAGADEIYCLGGVQAIAAMALGTASIGPVDMLVGPGNAYRGRGQAAAVRGGRHRSLRGTDGDAGHRRRQRRRRDLRHRPARPGRAWSELAGGDADDLRASLARDTLVEIERLLGILPTAEVARRAWGDYGEVILCEDEEELVAEADRIASEHVQVMTRDPGVFLARLQNYGALFLGPRTTVAFGDKVIGTNHTLPTQRAARYTGGLWVGKFLKTCTYQRIDTDAASASIGEVCSRLSMMEGFAGHAEQANVRVRRYGGRNVPYAEPARRL